jgi:hypothetical protein
MATRMGCKTFVTQKLRINRNTTGTHAFHNPFRQSFLIATAAHWKKCMSVTTIPLHTVRTDTIVHRIIEHHTTENSNKHRPFSPYNESFISYCFSGALLHYHSVCKDAMGTSWPSFCWYCENR